MIFYIVFLHLFLLKLNSINAINIYGITVNEIISPADKNDGSGSYKYKYQDSNNTAIVGTNIGGWMVLEPWITPSLFYRFLGKEQSDGIGFDSYTFCEVLFLCHYLVLSFFHNILLWTILRY